MSEPGQIIMLNGPSSAGKSTLCDAFVQAVDDPWFHFGMDMMGDIIPPKFNLSGERSKEGMYLAPVEDSDPPEIGLVDTPLQRKIYQGFHEMIATLSRTGLNVIADNVTMIDPPHLQDCVARLKDLPVLFVYIDLPMELVVERMGGRAGSDHLFQIEAGARWTYRVSREHGLHDLTLDSSKLSVDEEVRLLQERLGSGEPGTAFRELAERFDV